MAPTPTETDPMTKDMWETHNNMMVEPLETNDPEIFDIIKKEKHRQTYVLELIASENFISRAVQESLGSCLTNKYSEGYPGQRYYSGTEHIDDLERLCQKRALQAFSLDPEKWGCNVQPHSGCPANFAILTAILGLHGRVMGLDVPDGGHTTHGFQTEKKKVSASSLFFDSMSYKVNPETGLIDYDKLEEMAKLFHPKLIIAGASCYPRYIDYARMRRIADQNGAYLMGDISHISGLIAAGVIPSAFNHCDVVMTTTSKTIRGPKAGLIFFRKGVRKDAKGKESLYNLEVPINQAVFPGLQGGPHNHAIAAVAVAMKQSMTPEFKAYAAQVVANCQTMGKALQGYGYKLITGGTDNHLILMDVRPIGTDGARADKTLEACGLICNRQVVAGDKQAVRPNGIRFGSAPLTSRGMTESDFIKVAEFIHRALQLTLQIQASVGLTATMKEFKEYLAHGPHQQQVAELREEVVAFSGSFPMPGM